MPNGRKRVRGTFAATVLLAASLAAAPAIAKKDPPPPPPPVEDPDPWAGCSPWGPYVYDVDCCDYPELIIPCESSTSEPVARPEDAGAESLEQ